MTWNRRLFSFLIAVLLLFGMVGFSFVEKILWEPAYFTQKIDSDSIVQLVYPQFVGDDLPAILKKVNFQVDSTMLAECERFSAEYGGADSPAEGDVQLTGNYEMGLLNAELVSFSVHLNWDLQGLDGSENYQDYFYNISISEGKLLDFEDCFALKTSTEAWADFVEKEGGDIDRQFPLPQNFQVNAVGVEFWFNRVEGSTSFLWEDLEPYFKVQFFR